MNQPRHHSVFESLANIAVGSIMAYLVNLALLPMLGFRASAGQNAAIVAAMTVVSFVRSYALRRLFERLRPKSITPPEPFQVCIACGKDWDGVQCGQHLNDWPFPVCSPITIGMKYS